MRTLLDLLYNRTAQLIGVAAISAIILIGLSGPPQPLVVSRWASLDRAAGVLGLAAPTAAPTARPGITGGARPISTPIAPGSDQLEQFNQGSRLVDAAAAGSVRAYTRDVAGGTIAYVVVFLDQNTHIEVITADGATLGSDATGDTIWTDHGRHLQTVEAMSRAPYAQRPDMELLGALAFGFHGGERTSDEGTVVINGEVQRVNPGRSALCIRADNSAAIGVFDQRRAATCQQAAGAGPVLLLGGRIANPAVSAETREYVPFNPLDEDFTQLDWRRKVFQGDYPKTMIGLGRHAAGFDYLVLMATYGIDGVAGLEQLQAMGCSEAIGGDDDTSTQLVWRGSQIVRRQVRAVPTAIGVYARAVR
jgi:hypothetical protein